MKAICSECNVEYEEEDSELEFMIEEGITMICHECSNKLYESAEFGSSVPVRCFVPEDLSDDKLEEIMVKIVNEFIK